MDISIIIVNWNTKELLLQCLNSIIQEKNGIELEIIVVDNASTDGSAGEVRNQYSTVKVIQNDTNLGFAKGNNIGIKQSSGRYICLINSDVIVMSECFRKMIVHMDANPSIGMLGPRLLWPDSSLQPSCKNFPSVWNNLCMALGLNRLFPHSKLLNGEHMQYFAHNVISNVDALAGAFLMVRKAVIDKVGTLDEDFFIFGEEIDWAKRIHDAGYEIIFFPYAEAIHFVAASSSKEPIKFYKELHRSKLKYWKKHHNKSSQAGFKLIVLFRQTTRLIMEALKYNLNKSAESKIKIKSYTEVIKLVFRGR